MRKLLIILIALIMWTCQKDDYARIPAAITSSSSWATEIYGGTVLPLSVQVLDQIGVPFAGVEVEFNITKGDASFIDSGLITDTNGSAYATIKFGYSHNEVNVEATIKSGTNDPVKWTFEVSKGRASNITIVKGNNGEGATGDKAQFQIRITDDFGHDATNGLGLRMVVAEGDGTLFEEYPDVYNEGLSNNQFTFGTTEKNVVYAITPTDTARLDFVTVLPVKLNTGINSGNSATLSWNKSTCPLFKEYVIFRYDIEVATITDINTTSYDDKAPIGGTYPYYIGVRTEKPTLAKSNILNMTVGDGLSLENPGQDVVADDARGVVYLTGADQANVWVIDPTTKQIIKKIFIGNDLGKMDLSADGSTLFVLANGSGDLAKIDLESGNISFIDIENRGDVDQVREISPTLLAIVSDGNLRVINKSDGSSVYHESDSYFTSDLAIDYNKYIYYIDTFDNLVQTDINNAFTTKTKSFSLNDPGFIDTDGSGNIFVSNGVVLNSSLTTIRTLPTLGPMIVDKKNSLVYYFNYSNEIEVFDTDAGTKVGSIMTALDTKYSATLTNGGKTLCVLNKDLTARRTLWLIDTGD